MSFAELKLNPSILKAIAECGYTTPTPIQEQAIPKVLSGRDLIASAQTGTGKTAAFVLPAMERLSVPATAYRGAPRILVLTPTRELANQITDAVRTYSKHQRVKCTAILGGMPYREQLRLLSLPVDMVVATPGRLIDHLERGRINLSRLEMLILDEADRMLDMGFSEDVEKIAAAAPANRQTLMFTATLDNTTTKLAQRLLKDPEIVQIAGQKATHANIEQRLHVADNFQHKNRMLEHLIADGGMTKAIIFSSTKRDADALARELHAKGLSAAALHGDMNQGARNRTISDMRRGKIRLLVATDVAARGLDVTGISHVINFDLPKFAEDYVHRIGRTGRAGATGIAISFVSHNEICYLDRIERYTGQTLPLHIIPGLEPMQTLRRISSGKNSKGGAPGRGKAPHANSGQRRSANLGAAPERKGGNSGERRTSGWGGRRQTPTVAVEYRSRSGNRPGNGK